MKKEKVAAIKPQLPKGFKALEGGGKFWSGQKPGDQITGKLVKSTVKHFPKGKYPARDANVYILHTADGRDVEVTQSGGLNAMEQVKKGQTVCIVFLGMKKLKGRREPMREYAVGVK